MEKYPNSLGITGEVFHKKEIIWANQISDLSNYQPSIDNMTSNVKDVRNIAITPVFSHQ